MVPVVVPTMVVSAVMPVVAMVMMVVPVVSVPAPLLVPVEDPLDLCERPVHRQPHCSADAVLAPGGRGGASGAQSGSAVSVAAAAGGGATSS